MRQPPACVLSLSAETLSAWRDGEIVSYAGVNITSHVSTCATCSATLDDFQSIAFLLRAQQAPDLRQPIWAGLAHQLSLRNRGNMFKGTQSRVIAAVAACVALIVLFALVFTTFNASPGGKLSTTPTITVGQTSTAGISTTTSTAIPTINPTITTQDGLLTDCSAAGFQGKTLGDFKIASSYLNPYAKARLPDTIPLDKPYKLQGTPDGVNSFANSFVSGPLLDPYGLPTGGQGDLRPIMDICNVSATNHAITGLSVKITAFQATASPMNFWTQPPCYTTYFTPPSTVVPIGSCGGAVGSAVSLNASIPANPTNGSTYGTTVDQSHSDYTLPVALPPGKAVRLYLDAQLANPSGLYTLSLGAVIDGNAAIYDDVIPQVLVAPITHEWDGTSCQQPAMLSQLPQSETNPPTYYLCPKS